jgi:hypothetical protein
MRGATRFQVGLVRIREDGQHDPVHMRWAVILMLYVAFILTAFFVLPRPASGNAPVDHPVAHVQPAPAPTVATVRVNGKTGPICILPTGQAKAHALELVKVP